MSVSIKPRAQRVLLLVRGDRKSPSQAAPNREGLRSAAVDRESFAVFMQRPPEAFVKYPESYKNNADLLLTEVRTLREQGLPKAVAGFLEKRLLSRKSTTEPMKPALFNRWWRLLQGISTRLTRDEPTDLAAIRAQRPPPVKLPPLTLSRAELQQRIEAAWVGRACGNVLGKPVEGWPRGKIEAFLREKGHKELDFYLEGNAEDDAKWKFHKSWPRSLHNYLDGMAPRDDDMDYVVLNLMALEGVASANPTLSGRELIDRAEEAITPREIGHTWAMNMPDERTYTAERIALRNRAQGVPPEHAGAYANPYREWIGATIRADLWGYISPGDPERAATLAHHDAVFSHRGNGVYGEMFFAALISAAFSAKDLNQALDAALAQIPAKSRFAQMVRQVREWERSGLDWDSCWKKISEEYGDLHWVHAINNGAIALAGLLYGKDSFKDVVTRTVQGGFDTDSNGATVGSVFGALHGKIPDNWVAPISKRSEDGTLTPWLKCAVFGHSDVPISSLVERAMKFVKVPEA